MPPSDYWEGKELVWEEVWGSSTIFEDQLTTSVAVDTTILLIAVASWIAVAIDLILITSAASIAIAAYE